MIGIERLLFAWTMVGVALVVLSRLR